MPYPVFTKKLLQWYKQYGRKNLPWQKHRTSYRVWISEIMLQQTQVQTVVPYYLDFLEKFPTVIDLANASLDNVLQSWAGLGYYSRARNCHKTAIIIRDDYAGRFPTSLEEMVALPGIGRSTASAILAFSQKQALAILDGNVKRVLTRYNAIAGFSGKPEVEKLLWNLASQYTPGKDDIINYTQAIMDLGATICTRSSPKCSACPVSEECLALARGEVLLYPEKPIKKSLPTKTIFFIVLVNNKNEILFERRPEIGIWGGLWSLPESSSHKLPPYLSNLLPNINNKKFEELPPIRHTFSHYKLIATPIRYTLSKNSLLAMSETKYLWHNPEHRLPKGVPAPIEKWLKSL